MPPKFDPNDPAIAELLQLFKSFGLSETKSAEAIRNPKTAATLKEIVVACNLAEHPLDDKQSGLVALLANQGGKLPEEERNYIARAIADGRLKTTNQLSAAIKYVEKNPPPIDDAVFDRACGVGFSITSAELYTAIKDLVGPNPSWDKLNALLGATKQDATLQWANSLDVKNTLEAVLTELAGPKPAAPAKGAKAAPVASTSKGSTSTSTGANPTPAQVNDRSVFEEGFLGKLHRVGENPQKHEERRKEHLEWTKGKVFTRFPPEPNGFLHIGHSKAIFVNFGYAAHNGGHCYLRYDDTNPEAEEARYFESILEVVRWLGYEPFKITYSSDHFQKLYELAVELTKRGLAYVCHCTGEEINAARGGAERGPRYACKHRDRPIEESLEEFEKMKRGEYKPGEAILRMKQDLEDGNPQMWDLVAYRVLNTPHHRTGDKWVIYPTYDFTHCLCDSFENITHSLCTTEFIQSRVSYEWLCNALDIYCPRQSEYGRLNIQGTVMSKRKLKKLVDQKHVMDWDDPRLYTLIALRRRGVPPGAIKSFVGSLGVSTSASNIQVSRFEQAVREHLELNVPRLLMVIKPLKVTIENLAEDFVKMIEKPLHPKVPELGTSTIPYTRTIYIDEDDFRLEDSKDYFRLAPGKSVGLFQAPYPITYVSHKTDESGKVVEVICREENTGPPKKPKAFIQWVAEHPASGSPIRIDELRVFHRLFKSDDPAAEPDFLKDVAPDTLEVVKGAIVEIGFLPLAKKAFSQALKEGRERTNKANAQTSKELTVPEEISHDDTPKATAEQLVGNEVVRFQGLRVAYFALDKDAKLSCFEESETQTPGLHPGDKLILNRIVSLKEDSGKSA
ncbi:Probable glutamine--tRNA ligase; AltName: Full=Glutaminyl-tRNA synthetase; Short=GlnRS [Serendipita indica DSM 11827]|nr:Probable glutamine--tRNA ligase; AltName: Full=Glutaminyl-tRNA synthetase; Short=GlnRS [Serendipita indica DSM 11827]